MCEPDEILPIDIWNYVIPILSIKELANIFRTSKKFKFIIHKSVIDSIVDKFLAYPIKTYYKRDKDSEIFDIYSKTINKINSVFWVNIFSECNFRFYKVDGNSFYFDQNSNFHNNFVKSIILSSTNKDIDGVNLNFIKFAIKYFINIMCISYKLVLDQFDELKEYGALKTLNVYSQKCLKWIAKEYPDKLDFSTNIPLGMNIILIPLFFNNVELSINLINLLFSDINKQEIGDKTNSLFIMDIPNYYNTAIKCTITSDSVNNKLLSKLGKDKKDLLISSYKELKLFHDYSYTDHW